MLLSLKYNYKVIFTISFNCILICLTGNCIGQQSHFKLTGTIINADDRSPMIGATVYLSNTTIGTVTSENGLFILTDIPSGNYELVASFLGYKTLSVTVSEKDSGKMIEIALHGDVGKLKGITIRAKRRKDKKRKAYFSLFKECFIGTDENAANCKILNPEVLYYGYDEKSRTFMAAASEPLLIINEALGYKIYYDLQSFSYNFDDHHIIYFGYPRFENLVTTDSNKRLRWKNNRIITYQRSKRFFMLTLRKRQLSEQDFQVNKLIRVNKDSLPPLPVYSSREIEKMLHENAPIPKIIEPKDTMYPEQEPYDSIIGSKTDSNYVKLKFNNSLRILIPAPRIKTESQPGLTVVKINEGKHQPPEGINSTKQMSPTTGSSISVITMVRPETYIDPNGVLTDPLAISVEGLWAFMHVADLLPFDYELPE